MCYTRRKIEGGVGALRESDDTNFLKPNGRSRNLNIYGCIAITHLLYIEHNLLQTGSGREEAQEHVRTNWLTEINMLSSYLHLSLLDHDEAFL